MYQSKGEDTIKILCIQKSEGTLISSDFLYAGHGIYLGGESPLWGRCRNCQPLAKIKGVYREIESERRWRQNSGPRNTNHI